MYIALLHTHRLVVILFLLLYLAKLVFLLSEKEEWLNTLTKKSKIAEMVISFLFLATGIGMLFSIAEIKTLLIIKFVIVAASIPIAIIGFKKKNKILASASVVLIIISYGLAEMNKRNVEKKSLAPDVVQDVNSTNYDLVSHGKAVFTTYCQVCHGEEGNLGLSGAKNLQKSQLSEQEIWNIITNGKGNMAGYGKILSEQEIKAVSAYVQTLRK
ncbi:MAG: hypothetical protein OHK0038_10090 [Flammeovirgaceae bacterium]